MKKYLFPLAILALALVGCPSATSSISGITIAAGSTSDGKVIPGVWSPTGPGTLQLTATVLPSGAANQKVYWSSNDATGHVSVADGVVTVAGATGGWPDVTITASTEDDNSETGYAATFLVSSSDYP
jgi:hypothetical protein